MHLLLSLDRGFEALGSVALTSYLLHHRFESVVLVTPPEQRLLQLEAVAAGFGVPLVWQPIGSEAALHELEPALQPYFFCIEALLQQPGRYLYVDADTLCVSELSALEDLPLDASHPLAACSHGRPMHDRALVLGLESPFHYFNAGVMLFDASALASSITPAAVVDFYLKHRALCRFGAVLSQWLAAGPGAILAGSIQPAELDARASGQGALARCRCQSNGLLLTGCEGADDDCAPLGGGSPDAGGGESP